VEEVVTVKEGEAQSLEQGASEGDKVRIGTAHAVWAA